MSIPKKVKPIYNKKDYYTNKSTYIAILDTVAFTEKLLGKEMLSVGKTKQKEFVNWVACSVVAATVQFHPSCDKLEPYFRNTWSQNFKDMDECKNAADLLTTITEHAATLNLDEDFKNTPVHPNK